MSIKNQFSHLVFLLFALSVSQFSMAATHEKKPAMTLDNALSSLSFVSIKKGSVGEAHHIKKLSGSISHSGELNVNLHLDSVDTKIEIRDTRMKRHVFEEGYFTATIKANVGDSIPTAGVAKVMGEGTLNMHGVSKTLPVEVVITNTGNNVVISTATPIIIKASDFGMEAGVKKLQELAKLPSVATAVPVNFVLTFSK